MYGRQWKEDKQKLFHLEVRTGDILGGFEFWLFYRYKLKTIRIYILLLHIIAKLTIFFISIRDNILQCCNLEKETLSNEKTFTHKHSKQLKMHTIFKFLNISIAKFQFNRRIEGH